MLLYDLGVIVKRPIELLCDNKAAEHISQNPIFHERTKHLEVDYHFVREKIQDGVLFTNHGRSSLQLADLMTKALGIHQHRNLCDRIGMKFMTIDNV